MKRTQVYLLFLRDNCSSGKRLLCRENARADTNRLTTYYCKWHLEVIPMLVTI